MLTTASTATSAADVKPIRVLIGVTMPEGLWPLTTREFAACESGGACIDVASVEGGRSATRPTFGTAPGQWLRPVDLTLRGTAVFVLDRFGRKVVELSLEDEEFEWRADHALPFTKDPEAIESTPDGGFLILDAGLNKIFVLAPDLSRSGEVGGPGRDHDGMNCPHDFFLAKDGLIYVADAGNRRIQRYRLDGTCLGPWGSYGDGPDQFRDPTSAAMEESGDLVVADHYGHRLQVLSTATGHEIVERRLNLPENIRYPTRIIVLPGNTCVFSCAQMSEVWEVQCP